MPFNQIALAKYRYYRLALAAGMGLLTLILTLGIRIYEQTRVINQDQERVARHTIQKLETLLQPANAVSFDKLIQSGQNCSTQQPVLQQVVARLQTLRAIAVVRNGKILCSSLSGTVNYDFNQLLPQLALGASHLQLRASDNMSNAIPTLVLWRAQASDKSSGLLFVYNIGILANFLLEPQPPCASSIVLNVMNQSLQYDNGRIVARNKRGQTEIVSAHSTHDDFSVSLFGDSAADIAWSDLP